VSEVALRAKWVSGSVRAFIALQNFMPLVNLPAAHFISMKFSLLISLHIPVFLKSVKGREGSL